MLATSAVAIIDPNDNVAVAIRSLKQGEIFIVEGEEIHSKENIDAPHKIALKDIEEGEQVIKYGVSIGTAKNRIATGELVHLHNLCSNLDKQQRYTYEPVTPRKSSNSVFDTYFMGFKRGSGEVGTRNHIFILPTVFCANGFTSRLAQIASFHP